MSSVKVGRSTWESQVEFKDAAGLMRVLRLAGFPLANDFEQGDAGESEASKIVCIAAFSKGLICAVVACPSGLVYQFEPDFFEDCFWQFAARHYYVVTGNRADRTLMSTLTGVDVGLIKGRTLVRSKTIEPSGLTLSDMFREIGYVSNADRQQVLF